MTPARPPGRRPGNADVTRREILTAARASFAEGGFDRATIRDIAGRAGVDPALVHHHFGTKQSLFAAAHRLPDPRSALEPILTGPAGEMGERLARFYLQLATGPDSPVASLLRAAATNTSAARMLREFIDHGLLAAAEDLLPYDRPRLRVALCATHLIGVVFGRSIVAVAEMAEPDVEELVTLLGPALQRYLTGPI